MFLSFDEFFTRLNEVNSQINEACKLSGRSPKDLVLLPVTKNHPVEAAEYAARAGLKAVGENRVQEAVAKRAACSSPLNWELIGHLQSNKAKLAAEEFDRIQSVDSLKLVDQLAKASTARQKSLRILLQINAGRDPAKFGAEIEEAPALLEAALGQSSLQVEGLMCIAPLSADREVARRSFATLRELRDRLAKDFGCPLRELSMGMSGDLVEAIQEGSTQIRIGTALFGSRA